jgi:hypothetical protein
MVALPQIVVDVNSEGVPSFAGITPETVKALTFGQVDLSNMRIPKEYVTQLTNANVQHIEVVHNNDGLYIYANGKPLPHIRWDGQSIGEVSDLIGQLGILTEPTASIVKTVLPFVQNVGMDIVLNFPHQANAAAIPLADKNVQAATPVAATVVPSARARLHVQYGEDGVPSVMNVSSRDLGKALGFDLSMLELPPDRVQSFKDHNIQHVVVRSMPDGIRLWVNGQPLPTLAWSEDNLKNGVDLYGQIAAADPEFIKALQTIAPYLNKLDADLVLRFPTAPGAQPIDLPAQ